MGKNRWMTEPKLNFKPLSEGLGFHPYSNGLPYSPANPTPQPASFPKSPATGTGAVAAGRPSFAFPKPVAQPQAATATPAKIVQKSSVLPTLGWTYLMKRVPRF